MEEQEGVSQVAAAVLVAVARNFVPRLADLRAVVAAMPPEHLKAWDCSCYCWPSQSHLHVEVEAEPPCAVESAPGTHW